MEDQETPKVTTIAIGCQNGIANLLAAATTQDCCVKHFLHGRDIQQMQERYNQWAGNLGALQPPKSSLSLDHRLRDAPLVRDSILNTLTDLHNSIQAATDIAIGRRQNRVTSPLIIDPDTDLSGYDISSSESDTSSTPGSGSGRNALAPTSEIQELISAIRIGLDSLFKASIFVRKFAPKEKRLRAAKTKLFDNRADVMYVNDRYPSLADKNAALAARLGEANARRRQYFKYRRDHNDRLSTVTASAPDLDANLKKQSETILQEARPAKSVLTAETKPSLFAETEATAFVADAAAQARLLEMHEAPSAMSVVSFATSIAETSDEELPFPPVPAEAKAGSSFLCPYCLTFLQLKREGSEHQWRKHILQDLEPYICTFPSCGLDSFQSQHAWFEHELLAHRCRWVCSRCSVSFGSSEGLKGHISRHCYEITSDLQLSSIADQSKRPIDSIQPGECPFCDDSWAKADPSLSISGEVLVVDLDQFRRHVGRHLQQVAIFALPRLTQGHDCSLGSNDVGGLPDRDAISRGCLWVRGDCGYGWSIISRKRATFIAFAFFLALSRTRNKSSQPSEVNHPWDGRGQSSELTSMSDLAAMHWNQGQWEEAEKLFVQVMEAREKILGLEHPSTLDTVNNLGRLYSDQARLAEAEVMYQRALTAKEKMFGPEYPSTLDTVSSLGLLYERQGNLIEAETMHQRALAGREKMLGPDHPSTLDTVSSLGLLYEHQGKLAEAETMHQRALAGKEGILGLEHPSTLDAVSSLGLLYDHQGRFAEAETMHQRALAGRERILGPDHLLTLDAVSSLGLLYDHQGRFAEAETMHQRALAGKEKILGPDSLSMLDTVSSLGLLYKRQGRFAEAETMHQRALAGREKTLGPDHPSTLDTVSSLGLLYEHQGRLAEAETMRQRALAGRDRTARHWGPKTGVPLVIFKGHSGGVNGVAFSPDGQLLASVSDSETVRLWDPKTGTSRGILEGHSGRVWSVIFSPDGRLLASASKDHTVRLWDPKTGASHGTLRGHSGTVRALAFSPDGQFLASGSYDKTVRLWDPKTGASRGTLGDHSSDVNGVAFSPDGQLLASALDDRTVRLWDLKTGASRGILEGHSARVRAVAFSPDGQLLASTSDDNTVRLWDPKTGASLGTLKGHSGEVNGVAFSPDGQLLASASDDATVRLWDPKTRASRGTLEGHSAWVWAVAFSPDGQLLASASDDTTVRLWGPTPDIVR